MFKKKKTNKYKAADERIEKLKEIINSEQALCLAQMFNAQNPPKDQGIKVKHDPYDLSFTTDRGVDTILNETLIRVFHNCGNNFSQVLGRIRWKGAEETFKNIYPIKCPACGSTIEGDGMRMAWFRQQTKDL